MAEQGQQNIPKALRDEEQALATAQGQEQGAPADTATTEHPDNSAQPENGTQGNPQQQQAPQSQTQQASTLTQGAQTLGGNTAQAAPRQDEEDPNSDTWKQRYNVINGKYRAETGQLRQENEQLKNRIQQLEAQMQNVQPGGNGQSQQTPAPAAQGESQAARVDPQSITDDEVKQFVNQEMIDEFGMDYWKNQMALMRSFQPAQAPQQGQQQADERVEELENRLNQQSREAFYQELSRLVPDWEQINNSQEWNDFLAQVEPLTNVTYEALLQDAYDNFDSVRVSQLFNRFKQAQGQSPEPAQSGQQAPSVESQTMPGSTSAAASPQNQGQTMTFEQWEQQMAECAQATDPSSPAVQEKQKELDAAWREGRVTGIPGATAQQPAPSFV